MKPLSGHAQVLLLGFVRLNFVWVNSTVLSTHRIGIPLRTVIVEFGGVRICRNAWRDIRSVLLNVAFDRVISRSNMQTRGCDCCKQKYLLHFKPFITLPDAPDSLLQLEDAN